jgi:hypothetical protein
MDNIVKLKSIQISNLPELISNVVGVPVVINEIQVRKSGHISFDSESLIEHTGLMKNFYEEFTISSFSNGFTTGDSMYYWVMVCFRFMYKSGGSNGTNILMVLYDFEKNIWFTH